jgi:hypothetical protein
MAYHGQFEKHEDSPLKNFTKSSGTHKTQTGEAKHTSIKEHGNVKTVSTTLKAYYI